MSRMIFDLTDEDRAMLEAIRKNRGHRSHAETLRDLIRLAAGSGLPSPAQQAEIRAAVLARQAAPKPWSGGHPKPGKSKSSR
jgi:hypothetical protein